MKYIIVESYDLPRAILFDEILDHSWVATDKIVISAGKCSISGHAYGGSVTLNMKSRPEDTQIIQGSINRT